MGRKARYSNIVESASNAVQAARDALLIALRSEYPISREVCVIHCRGEYYGVVIGHDVHGARVVIRNDVTGLISRRWFREVELVSPAATQKELEGV